MVSIKTNISYLLSQAISDNLAEGDSILATYDIFPLDTKIIDVTTCRMYLSSTRLFISYDDNLEVYNLGDLVVDSNNKRVSFSISDLVMEGRFDLSWSGAEGLKQIVQSDNTFKVYIYEKGTTIKSYVLRRNFKTAFNYQTWGVYQQLRVVIITGKLQNILHEMIISNHSSYDPKFLISVVIPVLIYFATRVGLTFVNWGFAEHVVDYIFIGVMLYYLYKIYLRYKIRLTQFERIYLSFQTN